VHSKAASLVWHNDFLKLAVLIYRCLHGLAPRYFSDYIQRRRLRSSSSSQLVIQRTRLSIVGDRAFPVAGSRLWYSLPPDVTSAPTLTVFFSEEPQDVSLLPIISFLTVLDFWFCTPRPDFGLVPPSSCKS